MKTTISQIRQPANYEKKVICPPSSFPDTFKDFFQTLNEDDDNVDILATMLEDKLIPRKNDIKKSNNNNNINNNTVEKKPFGRRGMSARHYQRRSSEFHRPQSVQHQQSQQQSNPTFRYDVSPTIKRRRSSSIAVTRAPPDLHRFLQAEQQRQSTSGYLTPQSPRSHLSPNATQCNTPLLQSPGCYQSTSPRMLHLSPGSSPGHRSASAMMGMSGEPLSPRTPRHEYRTYRTRTSSMPVVPRHRPMLAEIRRGTAVQSGSGGGAFSGGGGSAFDCDGTTSTSEDIEYYRLRSFSITANGIFNLGDSLRSRRSRSNNSVTSTGTSGSGGSCRDRNLSSASQASSNGGGYEQNDQDTQSSTVASYKVGMLGAAGVGKTALNYQFTTSEYICAYDASLDEEYGQKTVSVMLDGQETELEIIDHPSAEMSVESFCATYNVDVFVIVYSIVDRKSFKTAEEILLYLWKNEYMATKGVILVGNKADLERKREVPMVVGRRLANSCGCKFIETSSGLDHNVDELLVGILAQVKLNSKRERQQSTSRKRRHKTRMGSGRRILKHLLGFKRKTKSCENLFVL